VERIRLFVYGSLKRGFAGQPLLDGARFEATATTGPGYALYDLGPYPALVTGGDGAVHGELYWVTPDHLAQLDQYEGPEYAREQVLLADGSRAEAYVMAPSGVRGRPHVAGGLWISKASGPADF
jgi:gamma-glutamylaminecyclotransferase